MKRPVILILIALAAGFCLGLFFTHGIANPKPSPGPNLGAGAPYRDSDIRSTDIPAISAQPAATPQPLDPSDDAILLARAEEVLTAVRDRDYKTLSAAVHPVDGVTFTPYSTVDPDCNQVFSAREIAGMDKDCSVYTWGINGGSGDPIKMTFGDYVSRYVFNADYTQAPFIGLDQVHLKGNALENVSDVYPDSRFVEYHFPGLDQKQNGYDWCSLKLVFKVAGNQWYLVGVIHSEWTI